MARGELQLICLFFERKVFSDNPRVKSNKKPVSIVGFTCKCMLKPLEREQTNRRTDRHMCEDYGSCLVCLSVYLSVPALAASASVETSKQRYSRVSL